ncbi:hypothetical protein [Pedobacter sp.]|uniref:hypothetical protein n=1 Tax=Pedobacter sp. TaxID=1411316 RepID=UPI003D7FFD45
MKSILIFLTFLLPLSLNPIDQKALIKIRNLLVQAAESKAATQQLQETLSHYESTIPVIKGYTGVSIMVEAKHMFNPMGRWNKFKKGRAMVEEAISKDAANFELRYLRFAVQTNVPAVLGYSKDIETDKKILMNGIQGLKDQDLKNRVIDNLLAAKLCTPQEVTKLKQWKSK